MTEPNSSVRDPSVRRVIGLAVGIGLLATLGLLRLETDNSPEVFFPQDSSALDALRTVQREFDTPRQVRLSLVGDGLFDADGPVIFERLTRSVEQLPSVARVVAPVELLGLPSSGTIDPERFHEIAVAGLAKDLGLVDIEGRLLSSVVEFDGDRREVQKGMIALNHWLEEVEIPSHLEIFLTGLPVLDSALDVSSREILRIYFPLLVMLSAGLLGLALRRFFEVLATLLYVGFCQLTTLGLMGWLGIRLNLVLSILPPVLFVIAMATAVHLVVRFRLLRGRGLERELAIVQAMLQKRSAILWTGATTFVGFLSLTVSDIGPVRTLGFTSAAGIVILTVSALTLLPALLRFGKGNEPSTGLTPFDRFLGRLGRRWAVASGRNRHWVLMLVCLSGTIAGVGWSRLTIESNALNYLAEGHPVRSASSKLETMGVGSGSMRLVFGSEECELRMDDPESWERWVALSEALRSVPQVLSVVGPGDVALAGVSGVERRFGGFGPALTLGEGFEWSTGAGQGQFRRRWFSTGGCRSQVLIFFALGGIEEFESIVEGAVEVQRRILPKTLMVVTGEYPLLLSTQRRLLSTFATSFALSLFGIAILFWMLTRSLRRTLLALVPNVWPVVMAIGFLGWLGSPLDIATVMVAAVILGLAVDDTVHTLAAFEKARRTLSPAEAIAGVMERGAPAYVLTSTLLAVGFGVCAFSSFAPTARFGGLASLAMVFVLAGALFVLPALLGSGDSVDNNPGDKRLEEIRIEGSLR